MVAKRKDTERERLIGSNTELKANGTRKESEYGATKRLGNCEISDAERKWRPSDMFTFAQGYDYVLISIGLACAIVHGAGMPILSIVFGGMTNVFLTRQPTANGTITSGDPIDNFDAAVTQFAWYYAFIGLAMFATSYGQIAAFEATCERQIFQVRQAYFKAVLRQQILWFDERQSGEMASRLNDDMERVREGLGDKLSQFIQMMATFVAGFTVGFIYNWQLTLVMMSLSPLIILCSAWMSRLVSTRTKLEQQKYAVAGGVADEALSCIRTVTAFNAQQQITDKYDAALIEARKSGLQKYFEMGAGVSATMLIQFCAYGLAFWFGSTLILRDAEFDRGTVFTVFFAVMNGSSSLGQALPIMNTLAIANGASKKILECIRTTPKIDAYSEEGLKPNKIVGKIVFNDIKFAYPLRPDLTIMKKFNLTIAAGKNIAIVGASGCGKSTLVSLLLRFYDPMAGRVTIDDYDIKTLNVHYLRRLFGVVSQEPVLFDGSLEENIKLGKEDASPKEIQDAVKMANIGAFIRTLPEGLQTRVGERGAQLSGGQKQRIAIARALISNPQMLLLDEATSALDTESEVVVQQALQQAAVGRTTITIAHRLSTIKDADHIIVLNGGEIVEEGDYHELMASHTIFYKMVQAQQLNKSVEPVVDEETPSDNEEVASDAILRKYSMGASFVSDPTASTVSRAISYHPEMISNEIVPVSIKKIMNYNRDSWWLFALGLCGNLLNGVVMPAFALFYAQIFAVYSEEGEDLRRDGIIWSLMFVVLGLVQATGFMLASNMLGRSGENLVKKLRVNSFNRLLRVHMAYYDDPTHTTGALCTRLTTDGPNVRFVFTRMPSVLSSLFTIVAGVVIAFIFGWRMALVMSAMVPILAGSGYLEWTLEWGRAARGAELMAGAGKVVSEAVGNVRTVQALTAEQLFLEKYIEQIMVPYKLNMRHLHTYALAFAFSQAVPYFLYAAGFRYGGYLISIDLMVPLDVYRVFFAVAFCGVAFGQMSSFIPDVVKARVSAFHMFRMIETPTYIDPNDRKGVKKTIDGSIQLKNISFSYPMRRKVKILRGLSLTIEQGQTVALVGPSGCGKSTVIALLERFYDPNRGEIFIDDQELRTYNISSIRRQIGLVSQEPILFNCTIEENITFGLSVPVTHQKVVEVAELANIHKFILSLPQGYATPVGEKGTQLSGGQKQRIAIARALIRNPRILLLDEATSALDTESEKVVIVQVAIDKAREGRTCIMIAHRLSTIQNADVIAVVKEGKIVEKGTHQELLDKHGLYSELCKDQLLTDD